MSHLKVPAWFITVLVIMMLPLVLWPLVMSYFSGKYEEEASQWLLIEFFPIYAILTGWLSYKCYPGRRELSYILLGVLLLAYLSLTIL